MTTVAPSLNGGSHLPRTSPLDLCSRLSSASVANGDRELRPVLEEDVDSSGAEESGSSVPDEGDQSTGKKLWEKLRRVLVVVLLVSLVTLSASAYSMVGSFLPIEVRLTM